VFDVAQPSAVSVDDTFSYAPRARDYARVMTASGYASTSERAGRFGGALSPSNLQFVGYMVAACRGLGFPARWRVAIAYIEVAWASSYSELMTQETIHCRQRKSVAG